MAKNPVPADMVRVLALDVRESTDSQRDRLLVNLLARAWPSLVSQKQ